ncbi:MAG: hypothetical protein ACQEQC_08140 [Elusimicrobiota bacterium]
MKYFLGLVLFFTLFTAGCGPDKLTEDEFVDIMAHRTFYTKYYMEKFGRSPAGQEEFELEMDRILSKYGVTMEDVEDYADNNPGVLKSQDAQKKLYEKMEELERHNR